MTPAQLGRGSSQPDLDYRLVLNLSILFGLLLAFNFASAWISQYYFNDSIIAMVSWTGPDPSWMPSDVHLGAALGVHYFGDFEQYVGYARSQIPPYSSGDLLQAAYGPFAIVFIKVLDKIFRWPYEVFVFLLGSLVFFVAVLVEILGRKRETLLFATLLLMTDGVILELDRGNLQMLVEALFALFCLGMINKRRAQYVGALSFAIALKAYAAIFLLVLIKQKKWFDAILILVLDAVLYLIGFLLIPGGIAKNFKGFFTTNIAFAGPPGGHINFLASYSSLAGDIYKFLLVAWGFSHLNNFYAHLAPIYVELPGIIVAILCVAILFLSRSSIEIELIAILGLIQLAPATAAPYLLMDLVIELCLLLRYMGRLQAIGKSKRAYSEIIHESNSASQLRNNRSLTTAAVFLVIGLVPWIGRIGNTPGADTTLFSIVGSLANLSCMICVLVYLIGHRRKGLSVTASI